MPIDKSLKPGLTLSICAKNAQGTIERCLKSIESQSSKPTKVNIVIDDPNDATKNAVTKDNVEIIISPRKGLYNQRNMALTHCDTEYLAFTDADCVLDRNWVKNILTVFEKHPEVAAGTGKMPPLERHNFASWLHYMFYPLEDKESNYTQNLIGGNSYFKTKNLLLVNGWSNIVLPNAEDVEISNKMIRKGYPMWFEATVIAYHDYRRDFWSLIKCSFNMGYSQVKMVKNRNIKDFLFYYTIMIPVVLITFLFSIVTSNFYMLSFILGVTFIYLVVKWRSFTKALPRWFTRWMLLPAYSLGIIKAMVR